MEQKIDKIIRKFMVFFLILVISAASYAGFFANWAFRDGAEAMGFTAMVEETAKRPFVHRQLLPQTVKRIADALPEQTQEKLEAKLIKSSSIGKIYAKADIPREYVIEYHLMYFFCFLAFFAAIWILRSLLCEIVQDKVTGTLGAMFFALIFPFFEVLGGYYYDIFEILFMFMAARFALHGNWPGLVVLAPIAEANKESFLFFLLTLYPLARSHYEVKKAAGITLGTAFIAGVTYLYIRALYAGNPGDMADWRIKDHLGSVWRIGSYFNTTTIYGVPLGRGMFLPHMICVYWIVKKAWHHLTDAWKNHAKLALLINGILYFMFVLPDEIRDLSLLYVSFIILTAFFIRDVIKPKQNKATSEN